MDSKKFLVLAFLLVFVAGGRSQTPALSFAPEDREIFRELIEDLDSLPSGSIGQISIGVGALFLGTPYVANTLEADGPEKLVVNLRGLDCTTFVENVLALGQMKYQGKADWESYLQNLERIRYREGRLLGYTSRLHYFTDWIRDNQQKGLVKDITQQIGGVVVTKEINFMGKHPDRYRALELQSQLDQIRTIEASLSQKPLYIVPQKEVARRETLLRDGDIIALATDIQGLDVTHTGIAVAGRDGRIHLLHASTGGGVMVTEEPLSDYLKKIKRNTGIIVVRPLEPGS